jgi:hypothetical protein
MRIQVRGAWRQFHGLHSPALEGLLELYCEQRVPIMDQVSLPDQEAFRRMTEVACELTHPKAVGLPRHSRILHPSTRQVDEEEHQESRQTLACPSLDGEEIRRHNDIPMPGQKLLPGGLPVTLRACATSECWRLCRAPLHGLGWPTPLDSPVAPIPVLSVHADHQLLDLVWGAPTAWATLLAAIIFPSDQPASQAKSVAGVTIVVRSLSIRQPSFLARTAKLRRLVVAKPQSLTSELLTQHAILFLKVVDDILLSLV